MALIKGGQAQQLIKNAIVLDLGDIERQADQMVQRARQEARQIVDQARAEAQKLVDTAAERGHAEGLERGAAEGREIGREEARTEVAKEFRLQLEHLSASWETALQSWETQRSEMLDAAREDVVRLALALAEKVVYRIVEADPTIIEDQLAEALTLLVKPTAATVRINPEDRPVVDDVLPGLMQRLTQCKHINVVDDPSITLGGCFVSTAGGGVDATIERQLDRVIETMLPGDPETDAPMDADSTDST